MDAKDGDAIPRDVTLLSVLAVGGVHTTVGGMQVVMTDASGAAVLVVSEYLRSLAADGASSSTLRSYALALLRWWRFLVAIGVSWDEATSVDVRDFIVWMRSALKRRRGEEAYTPRSSYRVATTRQGYAPATINHNLAVVGSFYAMALESRTGARNPVPSLRARADDPVFGHHNPMQPYRRHRRGPLRQRVARRTPRGLPDDAFDRLFAATRSHRDRALLAFYVSTGARASELLGVTEDRVDVGRQVVGVHRKGTQHLQWLPASADAFVWLRLYQEQQTRPIGERALWLTLRPPYRPLTYMAMRRVLQRANEQLATNWTLHQLRHTAAQRMVADPSMSLTDIQWVLGHAHLATTEIYLAPREAEVVARVLEHHAHREEQRADRAAPPARGYSGDAIATLLGDPRHGA